MAPKTLSKQTAAQKAVSHRDAVRKFRQSVKEQMQDIEVVCRYSEVINGQQTTWSIIKRNGDTIFTQLEGDVSLLPPCAKTKRSRDVLENEGDAEEADVFNRVEAAAGAINAARVTRKKAKTVTTPRKTAAAPKARRAAGGALGAVTGAPALPTPNNRTLRSATTAGGHCNSNVFQDAPIPDNEERTPQPVVKTEVDEIMSDFGRWDLASRAGSVSTMVYSRETSMASEPVASTSRI